MRRTIHLILGCLLGGLSLVAVMSVLGNHPRAAGETHELLINPGFEQATGGVPDGWSDWGGTLEQVSDSAHSGSHAAVFTTTSADGLKYIYQTIAITGGESYTFSGWILKDAPTLSEAYLRVRWYASDDGSGSMIGSAESTGVLTDNDPQYRLLTTGEIAAPDSAHSAKICFYVRVEGGAGAVFIDDASFQPWSPPSPTAELQVDKRGPDTARPGETLTYQILLSNTGAVTATSIAITDVLPAELMFNAQSGPFVFSRTGQTLLWALDQLPTGTVRSITLTVTLTDTPPPTLANHVTATARLVEPITDTWLTAVPPDVRLYALAPASFYDSGEAVALINLSPNPVSLDGWCVNDDPESGGVCLPSTATLSPTASGWIAQDADAFHAVWGFDADWASETIARPVPITDGSWPRYFFTDSGEAVYLLDGTGIMVDALAYGDGAATTGWQGPPVPYHYPGYYQKQVVYRKLDQETGLPVPDTDTAADWAQDGDDPIDGRKLRYPGWDLEEFFHPAEVTTTSAVTLAAAPDGALALISQTLAAAQEEILIEGYTFESVPLYNVLEERIRAGVVVTVLLESKPNGIDDAERWIAQRLHAPPTGTVAFIGETAPRYRYQHAKFALVDDRVALVSTDNFGEHSLPSDPLHNGTMGHRGFVATTDNPGVIDRLRDIFQRDCDLAHPDVTTYHAGYAPPADYAPIEPTDWTTYTARFSGTFATTATHFTLLQAPENALRDQDGLLGLLGRAGDGDRIAAMQMSEPFTWTEGIGEAGLNPRVQALVNAARSGAEVRLLLDAYYDDPTSARSNTVTCIALHEIASTEGLPLSCRLANVTGLGIHAKTFAMEIDGKRWVHLGSINGTENANKANREVALQIESEGAYRWMLEIFDHDWQEARGPMIHHVHLPFIARNAVPPADHPLITELAVVGDEWIELFNPGPAVSVAGWTLGDAVAVGDFGDGRYAFPPGSEMGKGEVIVVAACATTFAAEYGFNPNYEWAACSGDVPDLLPMGTWEGFGMALGNGGDEVLLQADGRAIDIAAWGGVDRLGVVPYTDFEDSLPSGSSLKRYPPSTDRDNCARDFYVSYSPSPGIVAGK